MYKRMAALIGISFVLTSGLFNNCAPEHFAGGNDPSASGIVGGGNTCDLTKLTRQIKVMFIVDTSGSNSTWTQDRGVHNCADMVNHTGCTPPTDPNKTFRGGSISAFFNKYQSKTNFSWAFDVFSGATSTAYIASSSHPAFKNSAAMQNAITMFNNETDGGSTPYLAALSLAQDGLSHDPDIHSTSATAPFYSLVFLSDGYPTDAVQADGSVDQGAINTAIASIEALAPGRIGLSTVYYGTLHDNTAAATLMAMASAGQGYFISVDTASTDQIIIDDLIVVPSGDCH